MSETAAPAQSGAQDGNGGVLQLLSLFVGELETVLGHVKQAITAQQEGKPIPEGLFAPAPAHSKGRKRKAVDPDKPRRAPTAFNYYMKIKLEAMKGAGETVDRTLFTKAAETWKELDPEDKRNFSSEFKSQVQQWDGPGTPEPSVPLPEPRTAGAAPKPAAAPAASPAASQQQAKPTPAAAAAPAAAEAPPADEAAGNTSGEEKKKKKKKKKRHAEGGEASAEATAPATEDGGEKKKKKKKKHKSGNADE